MFADDIAIISDTVIRLQLQLKCLHTFCEQSKLTVNVLKTKIIVFKRGGGLSQAERWTYNNCNIEIVNDFWFVGVCFH